MLYIIRYGEELKLLLQCRKSSLCTVSFDFTGSLLTEEGEGFSVCVFLPICIIQLSTFLFFSFFSFYLFHHFHLYLHLLYLLVSVLPVDTSPITHIHTTCLDFTTFVN